MNYACYALAIQKVVLQRSQAFHIDAIQGVEKKNFRTRIIAFFNKFSTFKFNIKKRKMHQMNIGADVVTSIQALSGLNEDEITRTLNNKQSNNSKPPKKPKKINPFFALILILVVIFGGGYIYAKLFSNKNTKTVDTAVAALEKSSIKNQSSSTVTELPKEEAPGLDNPKTNNIQTFNHTLPDDTNNPKDNEDSSMYKQFCNANKSVLRSNIKFIANTNYDFAYLEKKYKKNDAFNGLSRNDITVGMVYFKDANTRVIELLDGKQNKCLIDLPWHQGLEITVYFDGIDVKEQLTGNVTTYLPGEKFSFVTLKTIDPKQKNATFETPAGKTIYSNDMNGEDR